VYPYASSLEIHFTWRQGYTTCKYSFFLMKLINDDHCNYFFTSCNWSLVSGNEAMIPPRHLVLLKDELRGSRSSTRYWFSIPTRMVVSSVYLAPWRIQIFFGGFWFLLQSVWVSINRNQVEELIFRSGKPNICVSLAVGSIVVNAA